MPTSSATSIACVERLQRPHRISLGQRLALGVQDPGPIGRSEPGAVKPVEDWQRDVVIVGVDEGECLVDVPEDCGVGVVEAPADVDELPSRVAAAGQVTLVHRDVGDRLQGDGDRAQVVGCEDALGELKAVGEPPGVGGRVGHRRPDVRGHGVVRVDDK